MQFVCNKFEDRLTNFISAFLQESEIYDEKFLYAMGQFLYLLSGDPAFSTALPFCSQYSQNSNRRNEDTWVHERNNKTGVKEVLNRV